MGRDGYDLKSLSAPKMPGCVEGLVVSAMRKGGFFGSLFAYIAYKDSGFKRFERLGGPAVQVEPSDWATRFPGDEEARVPFHKLPPADLREGGGAGACLSRDRAPGLRDYAEAYRSGKCTPANVCDRFLEALGDPHVVYLNAIVKCDHEDVREQARLSTERILRGEPLSVLDGIPVIVKDEGHVVGYNTSYGTRCFMDDPPTEVEGQTIQRLRAAGCIIVGKANMNELGLSPITGHNVNFGQCHNPYNPKRMPGGSSSGSACAVGAGLVPLAVGYDGGGSIRLPASMCGAVGLKATHERIGVVKDPQGADICITASMGHTGPIANSAYDAAVAAAVMSGEAGVEDLAQFPKPRADALDLAGLKVGVYTPWVLDSEEPLRGACQDFLEQLQSRGAQIVGVTIPNLDAMRMAHTILITSEGLAELKKKGKFPGCMSTMARDTQAKYAITELLLSKPALVEKAKRVRTYACSLFNELFQECDVIVTPAFRSMPPPVLRNQEFGEISVEIESGAMHYVLPSSLTGIPSIAFPVSYDEHTGLPVPVQVMAPNNRDAQVLKVAGVAGGMLQWKSPDKYWDTHPLRDALQK